MPKFSTFKQWGSEIMGHLSCLLAPQDPAHWQTPLAHKLATIWHDNWEGSRHMSHWINQVTVICPTRQNIFKENFPHSCSDSSSTERHTDCFGLWSHCCFREAGYRDMTNVFSTLLVVLLEASGGGENLLIHTLVTLSPLDKLTAL